MLNVNIPLYILFPQQHYSTLGICFTFKTGSTRIVEHNKTNSLFRTSYIFRFFDAAGVPNLLLIVLSRKKPFSP